MIIIDINNNNNNNNNRFVHIFGGVAAVSPSAVAAQARLARAALRKGQMWSALLGSLQIVHVLTEGLFGCSR